MAVVVSVVLLVAALALMTNYALTDKGIRDTKARIKQYRIVAEEQSLIRQVLEDKVAIAEINARFAPPPVAPPIVPDPAAPE